MKLDDFVTTASDAMTVRRVFGEPVIHDGMTVIPAASVWGGGGGGGGHNHQGEEGEGGGFGLHAHPAGAYIIEDGTVHWTPAVDVNRMAGLASAVVIICVLSRARVARLRARTASKHR
jgi:uncharacterized spore protein YtfJ